MKKKLLILCLVVATVLAFGSMGALAADLSDAAKVDTVIQADPSNITEIEISADCKYAIIEDGTMVVTHNGVDAQGVFTATFTDDEMNKVLEAAAANDVDVVAFITNAYSKQPAEAISISKASMEKLAALEESDGVMVCSAMMGGTYLYFHEVPVCTGDNFVMGIGLGEETPYINFDGAETVNAYAVLADGGEDFNETTVIVEYVDGVGSVLTKTGYDSEYDMIAFPVTGDISFLVDDNIVTFNDISGKWFEPYVNFVAARGIMNGMDQDSFSPDTNLTRAMMVTMLYRLEGEPTVSATEYPFTDVPEAYNWAKDAILWAAQEGIARGMTDTTFEPERNLTREQAATFIYRYCTDYLGYDETTTIDLADYFKDAAQIGTYAQAAMTWCVEYGIMEGIGDNQLAPQGTCTRAQMATIFSRVINATI